MAKYSVMLNRVTFSDDWQGERPIGTFTSVEKARQAVAEDMKRRIDKSLVGFSPGKSSEIDLSGRYEIQNESVEVDIPTPTPPKPLELKPYRDARNRRIVYTLKDVPSESIPDHDYSVGYDREGLAVDCTCHSFKYAKVDPVTGEKLPCKHMGVQLVNGDEGKMWGRPKSYTDWGSV